MGVGIKRFLSTCPIIGFSNAAATFWIQPSNVYFLVSTIISTIVFEQQFNGWSIR